MEKEKREFKGVWFPAEVWLDRRLTALEKIILMEIDSLDNDENCYASNEYLADFCQCSQSKVSKAISKLRSLGYVEVVSFDGRNRRLRSCLAFFTRQGGKNCYADWQKMPERVLEDKTRESTRKEKEEKKKDVPSTDELRAVLDHLNEMTGKHFRLGKTVLETMRARLSEGYEVQDFYRAIDNMCACWKGTEWERFLQPSTLFRPTKFDGYVNATPTRWNGTGNGDGQNAEQMKMREIYERDFSGVHAEEFE